MSLHRALAHSTILQIIGKSISTVLGFVAIAIMTRTLGVAQFGWYITASGFLQFVGIISDFGFTVTTSNMLAETKFDRTKLLNTLFTWRLITAVVIQGLAPLVFLLFPYPAEIKLAVGILAASFFALTMQQICLGYYRERLQMRVPTFADVLARLLLVFGVALAAYTRLGFFAMMGAVTLASTIATIFLFSRMPAVSLSFDRAISKAIFHKMWPTALSIIFNAFYLQGDRVILPLFVSQTEVGLYGAAYRVIDVVIQIAAIVMGMIMPLITFAWARGDKQLFKERAELGFNALTIIIFPMLAGIFVLAEPIMRFTAGATFAEAGTMLRWLSLCIVGICFGMVFGHIILAIDRQREALWIYASDAVLSIVGYLIFIPRFGWWGAVMVTLFSECYAGLGHTLLTMYYSKTRFSLSVFTKVTLASVVMGGLLFALQPLPLLISILLGAFVYTLTLIALRVTSWASISELLTRARVVETP